MSTDPSTLRLFVERQDLVDTLAARLAEGWRLALTSAHDLGELIRITHLLLRPVNQRLEIEVDVPTHDAWVPTLAGVSWVGGRFDREIRDLFGVEPRHHPLPQRMVRHGHWPTGWHPMRRDADKVPDFPEDVGSYPFLHVEGPGVYEIPVGPVHAGLIEPGHFRFFVVGETIIRMKARLWFVHRGVEKHFEGRSPADGIPLAERISGDTAVGHALAYAMAVEEASGIIVAERDRTTRAMLLELERIHNHVADLGAIVNDIGFGIAHAHTQRLRESLLRHHEHLTGHRLLRGGITLGGTTLRGAPDLDLLGAVGAEVAEIVDICLDQATVRDRLTGTAVLDQESARQLDVLGYVARASGLDSDARRDHPFIDRPASWAPVLHGAGDVLARFQVRAEEFAVSVAMVRELAGAVATAKTGDGAGQSAVGSGAGVVEAWRGTLVTRVDLSKSGNLARVKIVDPSFFNWPALPVALSETIVPDFPLANKSFNQSYAGNDL